MHVSPAGSIFLSNLTRCKVLVKPIDGSVFVQGCRECTFVAAARQLRIHDTHDSSFYLHCVSEPIIEACTAVGFAPFTWDFDGKDATFAQTTLHNTTNLWDKVCLWPDTVIPTLHDPHCSASRCVDASDPHTPPHGGVCVGLRIESIHGKDNIFCHACL